jgi:hypothetical protein
VTAALTPAAAGPARPGDQNQGGQPASGQDPGMAPPPGPVIIDGGSRACVALLLELRAF